MKKITEGTNWTIAKARSLFLAFNRNPSVNLDRGDVEKIA
jgi:hypothetical protein